MISEVATLDRTGQPDSAEDVLTRVNQLVPTLRDHARDTELARRVPEPTLLRLQETGAFRLTLPHDRGGFQASPQLTAEVLAQISRGDPSAAWVTSIFTAMNYLPALLPDEGAEELFATPDLRISGLLAPTGKAQPTPDGVVLSGKWLWNTGGVHSNWVGLAALEARPNGPFPIFCFVPTDSVTIEDNWDASGMSGTATNIITVENIAVPRSRILAVPDLAVGRYGPRKYDSDRYYTLPVVQFFGFITAPAFIGMARGAMDVYLAKVANTGITYTAYARAADAPLTHHQVATAAFDLEIAEMYLAKLVALMDQCFATEVSVEDRIRTRAYVGQVARYARSSVTQLFQASGASTIQHANHLQRYFRDVNSLSLHALVQPTTSDELWGRTILGLEPNTTYF